MLLPLPSGQAGDSTRPNTSPLMYCADTLASRVTAEL